MKDSKSNNKQTNTQNSDADFDEFDDDVKSKSQFKREMHALQDLGIALTKLTPKQFARIPVSEKLRYIIEQLPSITHNSAKKRHLQFIGKLMRSEDIEALTEAYERIKTDNHQVARQHKALELWRNNMLQDDQQQVIEAMESFINDYPKSDRQQLRQLVRLAQKEKTIDKPPANSRKLFCFLRDTVAQSLNRDDD